MENTSEETIGIVFEKVNTDNGMYYKFHSVSAVTYDVEDMYYIITSGEFEGSDEEDFDRLICNPDDLLTQNKSVLLQKCNYDDSYAIYIFPRAFIDKIDAENLMHKYIALASKLVNTRLNKTDDDGVLKTQILEPNAKTEEEFNAHVLKNMLKSEYEVEDSIIKEEERPQTMTIDINKIISEISAKIVGQEEAITALVTNIYYNQLLIDHLTKDYYIDEAALDSSKVAILLEGSTGTGKTAIVKEIAARLDLPFVKKSINSFSETGYVGPTITDLLKDLYIAAGRNIGRAERGVIFLDEVDKIANKSEMDGRDMKKGVQEELLGFISGAEYDVSLEDKGYGGKSIHFDTSKLTFILGGAWTKLREKKIKEAQKKNKDVELGFGRSNQVQAEEDKTYTITPQDYIDDGMDREFFGRIKVLTCTKTYEEEDLKNILLYSVISPLKNIERTVQILGYKGITYTDEFVDEVCKQAYEMGTGARGLQTIVSGVQNKLLKPLMNKEFDLNEPIELNTSLLHQYNQSLVRRYK